VTARGWTVAALAAVIGVGVAAPGTARAALVVQPRPVVSVLGDSFTSGLTGTGPITFTSTPWFTATVADLGWKLGTVVADPGGGYRHPGGSGTFAQALRTRPVDPASSYVLVEGGLNDALLPDAVGEQQAVRDLVALVHSQAPRATVILLGAVRPPAAGASLPAQAEAIRAEAVAEGLIWLDGRACSFEAAADGIHPTANGHRQIGDWTAARLQTRSDSGRTLHRSTQGWWTG
jgi:lysophospholipase L1-like esterase